MSYIKRVLTSLDQLGMAIVGGNEDCTVSATVGYFSLVEPSLYWSFLRLIIDTTFWCFDGKGHCIQAYNSDSNEDFMVEYEGFLLVGTIIVCGLLILPFYTIWLIKKIIFVLGTSS